MLQKFIDLIKFRESLYFHFPYRAAALMDLLDAITSYGHKSKSVIELTESKAFRRKYSSITDAISNGAPKIEFKQIQQDILKHSKQSNELMVFLDCTNNKRAYSPCLADRSIVHHPNPAPGNRPICVGHQYSMLALRPQNELEQNKHWVVPLSMKRVNSNIKGNEFGMAQLSSAIEDLGLTDKLIVSIGDSLYGSEKCRQVSVKNDNQVHVFRVRNNRSLFHQIDEGEVEYKKLGRRKTYGKQMKLSDESTYSKANHTESKTFKDKKGQLRKIILEQWNDMMIKGSKDFDSHNHPINLIKATVYDENDKPVFNKPLWIGILGKRKNELDISKVYDGYRSRYDIEHFFRFGKQKLLLDSFQTSEVKHEEDWWQLVMLSYFQLYLANADSNLLPKPWERYLPEYNDKNNKQVATPTQVQRNFENILSLIGTPANIPVARGKPKGRKAGEQQPKRQKHDIIFKEKKGNVKNKTKTQPIENNQENSKPNKIEDLIAIVNESLKTFNLSTEEFSNLLDKATN